MRTFFRQLSLPRKLILIGVVPLLFLSYIAFELYKEKSKKSQLLQLYSHRITQSENLSKLIDALQNERKLSFDRSINKDLGEGLILQRQQTDSLLAILKLNQDISLLRMEEYTFINELAPIRKNIDYNKITSAKIMDTYTTMIFRLNTLNSSFPGSNIYMKSISNELLAQRLFTEMQTYLGIIRSNIFNALHSKAYVAETLAGTYGVQKVFHSYEKELAIKVSPEISRMYQETKERTQLKPTLDYIDTVFSPFGLDTAYTADTWWSVSDGGINSLRGLQQQLWQIIKTKIKDIVAEEETARKQTLVFLILALISMLAIVSYTIHIITSVLNELNDAAGKIAAGNPDVSINIHSDDAIGSLAESVRRMEKQVRERTTALELSNRQLENSNKELEQFAYIASHDLQEPLRKIRTFADQLKVINEETLDAKSRTILDKISVSAQRMKVMINDILEYSQLERNEDEIKPIDLNLVLKNVTSDLELLISQKSAVINPVSLPTIEAIPIQMNQLFYNLINNAIKFSKEGVAPVIRITASEASMQNITGSPGSFPAGRSVVLTFSDNGIGFNQDYAQKIFDMFQRLSADRTGTGIGLALCKKIVENHKGTIAATSVPGNGTTFTIILPVKQS